MKKARLRLCYSCFFFLIILVPIFSPIPQAGWFDEKKKIRVAFIWQRWDILDYPGNLGMNIYKRILRRAGHQYDVDFEVYEFWDRWTGGDVQQGKLRKLDIDVVVGPGGFGG